MQQELGEDAGARLENHSASVLCIFKTPWVVGFFIIIKNP